MMSTTSYIFQKEQNNMLQDKIRGVLAVVDAGGDADTNAAVACSLLGAKYGYSSIPTRYIEGLCRKELMEEIASRLMEKVLHILQ